MMVEWKIALKCEAFMKIRIEYCAK
jgi:hypothetical protein